MLETERIVPVVIFLHKGNYPTELILGSHRHQYLQFRYLLCNLPRLSYEAYKASDNLVARLLLPTMNYPTEQKVDAYAQAVRGLLSLESRWEKQAKYIDFIDTYANLDESEMVLYQEKYPQEDNTMTGKWIAAIERSREEGLQQGMEQVMEQGMEQGIQQSGVKMLLRLLELKFGADQAEANREQVESADAETLLMWSDRILTAKSIEEVLG